MFLKLPDKARTIPRVMQPGKIINTRALIDPPVLPLDYLHLFAEVPTTLPGKLLNSLLFRCMVDRAIQNQKTIAIGTKVSDLVEMVYERNDMLVVEDHDIETYRSVCLVLQLHARFLATSSASISCTSVHIGLSKMCFFATIIGPAGSGLSSVTTS